MFSIFAPRYVKEAQALLKHACKLVDYRRDLLAEGTVAEMQMAIDNLAGAVKSRDQRAVDETSHQLDALFSAHVPPQKDAGWRENCEVILVAIVIAIGVRTYYLQPFTIPTGSMQPTLNGIKGYETSAPPPNILVRIAHKALFGRSYVNLVAETDDTIVDIAESKWGVFFTNTKIVGEHGSYAVNAPRDVVARDFHIFPGKSYRAGAVLARGYVDTGDHVFVDKISYNIRHPQRGDVFVFNTQHIATSGQSLDPGAPSQYYIKRLAGLPGDELRIDSPNLYVNGARALGAAFERVMSAKDGYRGYGSDRPTVYLSAPDEVKHLGAREYFALGDNSYNSADSRYWGTVPERNLMGRGAFVYWPFGSHWGLIR